MAVDLIKGGRVDLQKAVPSLKKVRIGLGWKENSFSTGGDYDLDVTAFLCKHDANGDPKCPDDKHIVFYNNLTSPNGEVRHSGDNRTGSGDGDDETIYADVEKILANLDEVSIVITIHDAIARKQNFGQITKSYVKIYNDEDGSIIVQYNLEDSFSTETAVQVGSLYKNSDGRLGFKAVGQGYNLGLADFCKGYGLAVK